MKVCHSTYIKINPIGGLKASLNCSLIEYFQLPNDILTFNTCTPLIQYFFE